jgi:hypothetical protein
MLTLIEQNSIEKELPNHFVCKLINWPRTYKLFAEIWLQPSCACKNVIIRQKLVLVRNVTQKYEKNKSKKYP